ncbi:hypothetical protein KF840_01920 [bacterium]|nr:hypothetical protein [bacterium]
MSQPGDPLWVVTSYFNPARSPTRRENFRLFRRHLDAPLLVVELAPAGQHQLHRGDADVVVSLAGDDRLWQKERLLNLGIAALPRHVRHVAWIDCDVVLERADWPGAAAAHLAERGGLLQLFTRAIHPTRDGSRRFAGERSPAGLTPVLSEESIGAAARAGRAVPAFRRCLDPAQRRANGDVCALGMAWAAARSVVERCGLYDGAIVGSGDALLVAAALAQDDEALLGRILNRSQRRHFLLWAQQARLSGLFHHLDALPQAAVHLWHGDLRDRGYGRRHQITAAFGFDPAVDLQATPNGPWRWSVPDSPLARAVAAYLQSRREQ